MYDGHQVCLRQRTVIIQTPVERFQIFPFQTQSRRHGMSSESQKQIPAPGQSFIHIIGFDGPARGFNHTFCFRAHDHRTVVFFLQTARNNTNQTFVAVLQTEDDDFVVLHFALLDHFYRPLIAENRHLLPALIQIDQFPARCSASSRSSVCKSLAAISAVLSRPAALKHGPITKPT